MKSFITLHDLQDGKPIVFNVDSVENFRPKEGTDKEWTRIEFIGGTYAYNVQETFAEVRNLLRIIGRA